MYKEKENRRNLEFKMTRNRWRFRACPRCEGAMYSEYGNDFSCFNCGFIDYNSNIRGGNNAEKKSYKGNY
tara:strand:+ start:514 stop:723 length:210 start_codon:yes stop_codon:yes gene_type:complete